MNTDANRAVRSDLAATEESSVSPQAAVPAPPGFPELPKPGIYTAEWCGQVTTYLGYSAEQMIAYGEACRATPAQAAQPVAQLSWGGFGLSGTPESIDQAIDALYARGQLEEMRKMVRDGALVYSAPQAAQAPERKPLSNAQIDNIWANSTPTNFEGRSFARAIERAHGIGCSGVGDEK